jgi:hypothetical protein
VSLVSLRSGGSLALAGDVVEFATFGRVVGTDPLAPKLLTEPSTPTLSSE